MSAEYTPWDRVTHYREALQHGHRYTDNEPTPPPYWRAKPGSHDDGELSGLFLGGIGAPVVGRDLDGTFARWHLQNGYHLRQAIDSAFFGLRWEETGGGHTEGAPTSGYFRLAGTDATAGAAATVRTVYSLFPVIHEHYRVGEPDGHAAGAPLEAVVEFWTPLFNEAGEDAADATAEADRRSTASWPVWFATITVVNHGTCDLDIDTVAFWPNVLGWRAAHATALDQPPRSWPGQTHSGNTATAVDEQVTGRSGSEHSCTLVGALQQRHPERPVHHDMEGEILVSTSGPATDRTSVEPCLKAGITAIDRPPERQGHTVPWAEEEFRRTGALPATGETWTAHWDEALASAVHRGFTLQPGASRSVTYTMTFDLPIVEFGEGRRWFRKHTAFFGTAGRAAREIAAAAEQDRERWRDEIAEFHRQALAGASVPAAGSELPGDSSLAATMLNELSFVTGGGTVWVERWARELDSDTLPEPRLGAGEHAGLLEGYDIGYYYYNTTDLWTYAWYAVARWWPRFAQVIFDDLLRTIPMEIPQERIYYRTEERAPILIAGKLPHDVGSVMEDPWHALNGYQMRDDSNLWKDHNPAFIVSYYLFQRVAADPSSTVGTQAWEIMQSAGEFILARTSPESGIPVHDEFGDSTWDNLGIRGRGSYSGSVTLAALSVLAKWGDEFGRKQFSAECRERVETGIREYGKRLWTGEYFRLCDEGRYTESLTADALIGFYLADLAGFPELSDAIGRERIASHLRAVVRYNHLQYHNGRVGPLLVAAPDRTQYQGDGGDELQVNEVLVGSAWIAVAMLHHYHLHDEARQMSAALAATLHGGGSGDRHRGGRGLQFRTPAALDGEGRFRAPLNMRPLSIWFLAWPGA